MNAKEALIVALMVAIAIGVLAWVEIAKADCRKTGGTPIRGAGFTPVECIKAIPSQGT